MTRYFTENEIEQLKELKNELLVHPHDYFFKGWNDFSEFKETFISMSSLQWHYLSSGLNLIIEFFKTLGQALYSLVTLQFSIASEQFCNAANTALVAIAKLSLDLGLLVLHVTRLLSLLMASFYSQIILLTVSAAAIALLLSGELVLGCSFIGIAIIGFCAKCLVEHFNKPDLAAHEVSNSLNEIREYNKMTDEVYAERSLIVKKINEIAAQYKQYLSNNRFKLFTSNHVAQAAPSQETLDYCELSTQLFNALDAYPKFNASRGKDAGYVANMYRDMQEHHAHTMLLADELFNQTNRSEVQYSRVLASF